MRSDADDSLLRILFDADKRGDPYPYLSSLRSKGGVFWDTGINGYVVTSYDLVDQLIRDGRLESGRPKFSAANLSLLSEAQLANIQSLFDRFWIFWNGSEHREHKQRWLSVLRRKSVGLDQHLAQLADAQVAVHRQRAHVDLVKDVLAPYVSKAVCSVLGVTSSTFQQVSVELLSLVRLLDGKILDISELAAALLSTLRAYEYLHASEGGSYPFADPTGHDLQHTASRLLILAAGQDSTAHLIAVALLALDRDRALQHAVRSDPALIDRLLVEASRFDSPVQCVSRVTNQDMPIGRHEVTAGSRVVLHIGAANRDPERFYEPNEFRLDRRADAPLSFGLGSHHCIGSGLAMREARAMIQSLLNSYEEFSLDHCQVVWDIGLAARGPSSVTLTVPGQ